VRMDAPAMDAVGEYLSGGQSATYLAPAPSSEPAITRAGVEERDGFLVLSADFQSPFPLCPPVLGFVIYDPVGNPVCGTNARLEPPAETMPSASSGRIEVVIPTEHLRPNRYLISLWLGDAFCDYCELSKVLQAEVSGVHVNAPSHIIGSMRLPVAWRFVENSSVTEEAVPATAESCRA